MAGGFLAIGSCISAANRNQVVAFIITVVICFLFLLAGFPLVLDFFGGWDYSLMFVMGGAIAVYLPVWYAMKCRKSALAGNLPCSARKDTDGRLFLGASIFGIGWGLAGVCPGPGIVLLGRPSVESAAFVVAMLAGMLLHQALPRKRIAAATG